METFFGTAGTITASGGLAVVIKSIQADVQDASVTDVAVTASGGADVYTVNGITPTVHDMRFGFNQDVDISSSGTLNQAIINYIYVGEGDKYEDAAKAKENWVSTQRWANTPQSGTYTNTFGG